MISKSLSIGGFYMGILGLVLVCIALYFFQYPQDLNSGDSVFLGMFIASASLTSSMSGFLLSVYAIFKQERNSKLIVGLVSGIIGIILNPLVTILYGT